MPLWEYYSTRIVDHGSRRVEEMLTELGREGWELVTIIPTTIGGSDTLYFKRPLDEQSAKFHENNP